MAVVQMKLATIVGPLEDFDNVVLDCIVNREFHPELASQVSKKVKFLYPFEIVNPYADLLRQISAAADHLGIALDFSDYSDVLRDRDLLEDYIKGLESHYEALISEKETLRQNIRESEQIVFQLEHLKNVNIEISEFFKVRYVKFRFGHLPRDTYDNFMPLIDERPDVFFFPTCIEKNTVYGMYMTPMTSMEKVDSLFASLQFVRVRISSRVHGNSDQAMEYIRQETAEAHKRIADIDAELSRLRESERKRFLASYSYVRLMNDSYNIRRYAAHTSESFYLLGWVPADALDDFTGNVSAHSPSSVIVTDDPENVEDFTPPVKLKHNLLSRAFGPFIEMYGMPGYNEVDPTPFFALSYMLLFGIMFGDLGQGAVLAIGGFLLWKLKGIWLARCVGCAGVFSMIFGFLYGSVFGNEHLMGGFKVLEGNNSNTILQSSINMGVVIILCVMAFNIANGIRQKNFEKIFFGPSSISGIIFYLSLMALFLPIIGFAEQYLSPGILIAIAALPFLMVLFRSPLSRLCARDKDWKPHNIGDFFVENIFEMLEVLLSYVTNTLSYLRVGAYAISHASMMMAVYMIAENSNGSHNMVVLVLGNIIIMCIEALLAGIQVLRLEYYEMFSRFFSGEGRPYTPYVIDYKKRNE